MVHQTICESESSHTGWSQRVTAALEDWPRPSCHTGRHERCSWTSAPSTSQRCNTPQKGNGKRRDEAEIEAAPPFNLRNSPDSAKTECFQRAEQALTLCSVSSALPSGRFLRASLCPGMPCYMPCCRAQLDISDQCRRGTARAPEARQDSLRGAERSPQAFRKRSKHLRKSSGAYGRRACDAPESLSSGCKVL